MTSPRHACVRVLAVAFAAACLAAAPAHAQDDMEEVLRGLGTATTADEGAETGSGEVAGRVFDASTGEALARVTVVLKGPALPGGQEVRVTDGDGGFEFPSVPPGTYDVTYIKAGYRNSTITGFEVLGGQVNPADFPLPPQAAGGSDEVLELEEFVVEAETAAQMMTALETRLESDQMLNILSAEDFSKYAASDVAEALERVAGINIVEGQFAIIRGLEDRYSSTLYNGAPIPSPDPDRQSVQLDLFPSEVVGGLTVAKTFSPELPSNSAGGAIDIVTHQYPDDVEFTFKAGSGFNDKAKDRFIRFDARTDVDLIVDGVGEIDDEDFAIAVENGFRPIGGNPVGLENEKTGNWIDDVYDVIESEFVATLGGTKRFGGREFRFKGVASREIDFSTAEGFKNSREPRPALIQPEQFVFDFSCFCVVTIPEEILRGGDLAQGELNLNDGLFDLTLSEREEQKTGFAAFGFDLDDEGLHKVDASVLWTRKEQQTVEFKENGFLPGFDYPEATRLQFSLEGLPEPVDDPLYSDSTTLGSFIANSIRGRNDFTSPLSRGALAWDSFFESTTFQRDRDLLVIQLNGDHRWEEFEGFHFSWAINRARTTQEEVALGMKYFYEPCGFAPELPCDPGVTRFDPSMLALEAYPASVEVLGPGSFVANNRILLNANRIEETSKFARLDWDYEIEFSEKSRFTVAGGVWWERANRTVDSAFLNDPNVSASESCQTGSGSFASGFACRGMDALSLGRTVFDNFSSVQDNGFIQNLFRSEVESRREINAWHARGKFTFWERLDLMGGVRHEDIFIESLNDPFVVDPTTGEPTQFLGGPVSFPSRYLLYDRFDNPFIGEVSAAQIPGPDATFNDQVANTGVVPGPCAGDDGSQGEITCVDFQSREALQPFIDGEIDEFRLLPSAGFNLRPVEGMSLRGAWSQTVARPSFRELGFYPSVEPGSDDITVGNPSLQLSDVESWDARFEYTWGGLGDLVAASWFQKTIELPVESIVLRDPANATLDNTALIRTFFNNPNTADLWGFEVEARKNFGFLSRIWNLPDWLRYLSIGGNYTQIDAEVDRTEAELARANLFFVTLEGVEPLFQELEKSRRLFGQPEFIANADITFDHPDWGTKLTFAWFSISDVLDAAGSVTIGQDGTVLAYTLDRYVDAYDEFRVTASQTFTLPGNFGTLTFKASAKNLTDSERRIVYDPAQTGAIVPERSLNIGRDYSFSITYRRTF